MDFIFKSVYAATQQINDLPSADSTTKSFTEIMDEYRLWIMLAALILSLISLGWQIFKAIYDNKKENKIRIENLKLSINEDFWHKSVVLPVFVDKFVESISSWIQMLDNCTPDKINEIRSAFLKDKRELSSRTRLLCTVNELSRKNIREHLDEIEDSVIAYLYHLQTNSDNNSNKPSFNDKIYIKVESIFQELIQDHHQLAANSMVAKI